jgi:hypothetical protein
MGNLMQQSTTAVPQLANRVVHPVFWYSGLEKTALASALFLADNHRHANGIVGGETPAHPLAGATLILRGG